MKYSNVEYIKYFDYLFEIEEFEVNKLRKQFQKFIANSNEFKILKYLELKYEEKSKLSQFLSFQQFTNRNKNLKILLDD